MAIRRFSTSNLSGGKSSKLWDQETIPGVYESIVTYTAGTSDASNFTFSNIPQNYTHLQIRLIGRTLLNTGNTTDSLYVRFNSDSTNADYVIHNIYGNGSSVSANGATLNYYQYGLFPNGTTTAFGVGIIDILDYTNTNKNKVIQTLGVWDANGSGFVNLDSGLWLSTAAINTITLTANFNFIQYTQFALYGVK